MRALAYLLLLQLTALQLAAPAVLLAFLVDQDRIMAELCVQRMVPNEERSCHGGCYLMKQLNALEQQEDELPVRLRSLKVDDHMPMARPLLEEPVREVFALLPPPFQQPVQAGYTGAQEPVPLHKA